jgi:hypothetical protein
MRASLLDPLKEVHGLSDKMLMMALSVLFLGAPGARRHWREVGGSMIAVDTLVHNFLHRTGILHRFRGDHAYGVACYRPRGCALHQRSEGTSSTTRNARLRSSLET